MEKERAQNKAFKTRITKKGWWIIILILSIFLSLSGEKSRAAAVNIIDSKEIKQIELEEVFRITGEDEEERYFLKNPQNLRVDTRGNIFFLDKDQLLVFDSRGEFLRNLYKKGQGPGEVVYVSNYLPVGNEVIIHNTFPNKIVKLDLSGRLQEEYRLYVNKYLDFFHQDESRIYFLETITPDTKGKAKDLYRENKIVVFDREKISRDKNKLESLFSFPIRAYVYMGDQVQAYIRLNHLKYCQYKGYKFFISNEQEYEVKLIDLEKKKILKNFKREYHRVEFTKETQKFAPGGAIIINKKVYRPPQLKYFNDIKAIYYYDNMLWVFTSTVDANRGVLVDRWDAAGKLVDQAYIKFSNHETHYQVHRLNMTLLKGFLYIIERDAEDNKLVVKYKMNRKE